MEDLINGRCGWCGTDELYMAYHDQEWGKLVTDDKTLFARKSNPQSQTQGCSSPYKRSSAAFTITPCHSFPTENRLSTHSGH